MRYASFVIRLWNIEVDASPTNGGFRGRIEHVQSGDVRSVTHLDDVAAFIQERLVGAPGDVETNSAPG